jgi:hypothetical protein
LALDANAAEASSILMRVRQVRRSLARIFPKISDRRFTVIQPIGGRLKRFARYPCRSARSLHLLAFVPAR